MEFLAALTLNVLSLMPYVQRMYLAVRRIGMALENNMESGWQRWAAVARSQANLQARHIRAQLPAAKARTSRVQPWMVAQKKRIGPPLLSLWHDFGQMLRSQYPMAAKHANAAYYSSRVFLALLWQRYLIWSEATYRRCLILISQEVTPRWKQNANQGKIWIGQRAVVYKYRSLRSLDAVVSQTAAAFSHFWTSSKNGLLVHLAEIRPLSSCVAGASWKYFQGYSISILEWSLLRARLSKLYLGASKTYFRELALVLVVLMGTSTSGSAINFIVKTYQSTVGDLYSLDRIINEDTPRSTKIYDRNGKLLYEAMDRNFGKRTIVPLSEVSPYVVKATISTEDGNFYQNSGLNLRGMARAAWNNLTNEESIQGGSSLTQQLVKNVLIPEEERYQPSLARKLKETALALEINKHYSKEHILEWYLNRVYYGNLSYGIEAAAQSYFGKSAKELDLAESAMLVGLPQAPALYSPLVSPELAKERQATVLDLLTKRGLITKEEAEAAKSKELQYQTPSLDIRAPHFVLYVIDLLKQKYGTEALSGGLSVTTTLDLDLQTLGESLVSQHANRLKPHGISDAALVAIDPRTGEVLTMVGSADYYNPDIGGQINMAVSERQPGSTFKPFTYLTAFIKGYTPATILQDVPTTFPDGANPPYSPKNVDDKFRGPVTVRQALAMSLNVPAVQTLAAVGIKDVLNAAHSLGITTLKADYYGLSLTLGGGEVSLIDMVFAYGAFANGGTLAGARLDSPPEGHANITHTSILKIEDERGKVLWQHSPQSHKVITPEQAYLITNILSDNEARTPMFGPSSQLVLSSRQAAVKTGTTDDLRDMWTIGYTPHFTVGVWVGNADNSSMGQVYSSTTAAPIWRDFMEYALSGVPAVAFSRPPGIIDAVVCAVPVDSRTQRCPKLVKDIFINGTVPVDRTAASVQNVAPQPVRSVPQENLSQSVSGGQIDQDRGKKNKR